jgi:prepilin-type N-terminal cleavage/methylation domain-containing protein
MEGSMTQRIRGFTLIEYLVAIAIAGILAGLLIPAIGAADKRSKKARVSAQRVGSARFRIGDDAIMRLDNRRGMIITIHDPTIREPSSLGTGGWEYSVRLLRAPEGEETDGVAYELIRVAEYELQQ